MDISLVFELTFSQGGGCKWWHFLPSEGVNELEEKFQEIIGGNANNHVIDKIIQGARSFKKSIMDNLITYEKIPKEDPSGELEIWSDHTSKG